MELQDHGESVSVAEVQVVRGSGYPVGLGAGLSLMAGILVIPFAIAGYVVLTVLLFLPLLGLRRMFPRPWNRHAGRYSGVGNLWETVTRRA
jgi:hypothetical protein